MRRARRAAGASRWTLLRVENVHASPTDTVLRPQLPFASMSRPHSLSRFDEPGITERPRRVGLQDAKDFLGRVLVCDEHDVNMIRPDVDGKDPPPAEVALGTDRLRDDRLHVLTEEPRRVAQSCSCGLSASPMRWHRGRAKPIVVAIDGAPLVPREPCCEHVQLRK